MEQLVFCGLIDEREKEITYGVPPIHYNKRLDHKINSFGANYYERHLRSSYEKIVDIVLELLVKVKEPIKKGVECDMSADKVGAYKKFLEEIKGHSKDVEQGGGCVLVT